jgi:hypothetical protein
MNKNKPLRTGRGVTGARDANVVSNSTPIYVGSKVVGNVKGNCFRKPSCASKHFLRTPPAIAFDTTSLRDAQKAGAKLVSVTDKETGKIYTTTIQNLYDNGINLNRGHGDQIALRLEFWCVKGKPRQLSFFENKLGGVNI